MKSLQPEPFPQSIVNIPLHRVSPSPASLCKFSEKCPLTGAYELGQSASQKVSIRVRRRPYSHKLKYQKFDTDLISTQLSLLKGYCSEFVLISKSDIANKITLILKGSDMLDWMLYIIQQTSYNITFISYLVPNIKKTMN